MDAIAASFEQALDLHRQGRLDDAERVYLSILAQLPRHFDTVHMLGVLHHQRGEHDAARELLRRAINIDAHVADAHSNLGFVLQALKRQDEALASFDLALRLNPYSADAHSNRGNVLIALGRPAEALESYDSALQIDPQHMDALNNRGNVLLSLGRPDEALLTFDRALNIRPANADVLNNRGNALRVLERLDDAIASYDLALKTRPDFAVAHHNRGNALRECRRANEALASYERAAELGPGIAEFVNSCGNALLDLGRASDALERYERALQLKPNYADALYNRGTALGQLGRYAESAKSFAELLALSPGYDYALGQMLQAQLYACDWSGYDETKARIDSGIARGEKVEMPFSYLVHSSDPGLQMKCAGAYAADACPPSPKPLWTGERYRHAKIRLAYLSADFRNHATAHLTAGIFEHHDRTRFETIAVSYSANDSSPMRARLEAGFDRFIDVIHESDARVAALLRELEIDIAVDLKGYTLESRPRILAHRTAPVQAHYLGFPGTMGARYIDYVIADPIVIPREHRPYYTEQIAYLPICYQCNDRNRRIAGRVPAREELGLPQSGFVFCSFNAYKIAPDVFALWMRLLAMVDGSVLWLLHDNDAAVRNLRREAAARGIAPERLVFAPRVALEDHLARQQAADLYLDTHPYNAHTTASDALWVGLPVIARIGSTFAGRVAASLLRAANLPELATHSAAEYEALALKLAREPATLARIKAKLRANRDTCPLFGTAEIARQLETAYLHMWERSQRGQPPLTFEV
jgi:predicted O-linked N-acetylglucosamine transferase (SPINDLY family)